MAFDAHKNFATSLVATAPSPATSGTSLVVTGGEGTRFPAVPFNATICPAASDATPANAEVVRVTAISTDTFTITRATESSSARTVVVGDRIYAGPTAKSLTDIESIAGVYRSVIAASGFAISGAGSGVPLVLWYGGTQAVNVLGVGGAQAGAAAFYFDPALFAYGALSTKCFVDATCMVNAVAPAATLTIGLYPISASAGASAAVTFTAGSVTSGSTVAFTTPGANSLTHGTSGDFTAPSAGWFCLAVSLSGGLTASNANALSANLYVRHV